MDRDPYIAIMVASANGRGLHLTADECDALSLDDAIATRAINALTEAEHRQIGDGVADSGWKRISTHERPEGTHWNGNCRDINGRLA